MKTKIYYLRNEFGLVKYVGMTTRPLKDRLDAHLYEARRGHKCKRCDGIRAILKRGLFPTIDLITEVTINGGKAEMAYIKWCRSKGIDLWNLTDGGEGPAGLVMSIEDRKKRSVANMGRIKTPEEILNISISLLGHDVPQKVRDKIGRANKGRIHTKKSRENMGKSHIGHKMSPANVEMQRQIARVQCISRPRGKGGKWL